VDGIVAKLIHSKIGTELISSHSLPSVVFSNVVENSIIIEAGRNKSSVMVVTYNWKENL
jgi:hypothetical protein